MLESIVVKNNLKIFTVLLFVLSATPAWSEEPAASAAPASASSADANKKRISIKFDNELVEGAIQNPSMDYMFVRKEANYKKMMRLRENFLPEVKKGKRDFSGSR